MFNLEFNVHLCDLFLRFEESFKQFCTLKTSNSSLNTAQTSRLKL